jgi:hypothetical protein
VLVARSEKKSAVGAGNAAAATVVAASNPPKAAIQCFGCNDLMLMKVLNLIAPRLEIAMKIKIMMKPGLCVS